jgi:formate dehydrogenase major subunit
VAGARLRVTTRRGSVECLARADPALPAGVAFMPFAFREAAANLLTDPRLDPYGKIPGYKLCAARVEPA